MSGALLAIARGALSGMDEASDKKKLEERQRIHDLIEMSNAGVSFTPQAPDPAAVPTPKVPDTSPQFGSAPVLGAAHSQIMDAARSAFNTIGQPPTSSAPTSAAAPAASSPAAPATSKPSASPFAIVHSLDINGTKYDGTLDPSQSPRGRQIAQQKANLAAYTGLNADGSLGEYDPAENYVAESNKRRQRRQVADALVKTGEYTPEQADIYATTGQDLAERARKDKLTEAEIARDKRPPAPTPGSPEYYQMVRRVAEIRAAASPTGANADPVKAKEKWVRGRMVALMKSPGKDPDLGTALPGLSKEDAIAQAGDEWDSVLADDGATPAARSTSTSTSTSTTPATAATTTPAKTSRTPAPAAGANSAKIKTLNAQYQAALARGVNEDAAWSTYTRELAKIKATEKTAGGGRASGQ